MTRSDEAIGEHAAARAMPEWVEPMAATLTQQRFTGAEWSFERKFDGIRLLAFKRGSEVRLFSRTRNERHAPAIAAAIARLPVTEAMLDGEFTWEAPSGYHVFDVLWLDGRDLRALPLVERRRALDGLALESPLLRVAELTDAEPWERARVEGWEGVIAKRRDAPYEHRRSRHWQKMKCELAQDFVVGGFTDPQGTRVGLGALLVGYYDGQHLVYAGKVGTGLDGALLASLRARLDASVVLDAPFTRATGLPRVRMHWVRPDIVVHVAFVEWTVHEKLRHSRLLAVRDGVVPTRVGRHAPHAVSSSADVASRTETMQFESDPNWA